MVWSVGLLVGEIETEIHLECTGMEAGRGKKRDTKHDD